MKHERYVSGDQNIFWDSVPKLLIAQKVGLHSVLHDVHTLDHFSRPPQNDGKTVGLSWESYSTFGNTNHWTPSLEMALFLGRMPVSPRSLAERGVRVQDLSSKELEEVTKSDWVGLHHAHRDQIAHDMPVSGIKEEMRRLKRLIRDNLVSSVEHPCHQLDVFDSQLILREDKLWQDATVDALGNVLKHFKCENIELSTSFDRRRLANDSPVMLRIFVQAYEKAFVAYNKVAQMEGGELFSPLEYGELPFYGVVENGYLKRVPLYYEKGDDLQAVITRAQDQFGHVVALAGKAIPYLLEMRTMGNVLLPEQGSSYASQANLFEIQLREAVGSSFPKLHKTFRVKPHALDALKEVEVKIRLPEYLADAFGATWVKGVEIANTWREVVRLTSDKADRLSGDNLLDIIPILQKDGVIGSEIVDTVDGLRGKINRCNHEVRDVYESIQQEISHLNKKERKKHPATQAANTKRNGLEGLYNPDLHQNLLATAIRDIEKRRASRIATLLAVTALPYWNNRPFLPWLLVVPGWLDAVVRNGTVEEEKI